MKSTKPFSIPLSRLLTAVLLAAAAALPARAQLLQQNTDFTRGDTLRGSITPQRAWWDVTFYDLHVAIDPADSSISGYNEIHYRVTEPRQGRAMQIDLQDPLQIDRVTANGTGLEVRKAAGSAYFVDMDPAGAQRPGEIHTVTVRYHGTPRIARNPPWDGGFVWSRDELGNPWIATANQGIGASIWWPNKDHQSDEPDSMGIHITVPSPLVNVSNGRLRGRTEHDDGTVTWSWFVRNPINNYNVAVNAGNYAHFGDTLKGELGRLDLDYWVLKQHLPKARQQFVQVKPVVRCFEHWFGPYPFYEDSFKLVHTPYLGMEHQSAIAYGNRFMNGYLGEDLSGTGWGLTWDYIIVHETGHEWFGNNITTKDVADMWVHEGFTFYSEPLYTECLYGKQAGADYIIGARDMIENRRPMIGPYGVNEEGSRDMYFKGGNLLHTIRQIVDDDPLWRAILRGLNHTFWHQTVTSAQVERYIIEQSGKDLGKVFDQYLRHARIPALQHYFEGGRIHYRWRADVAGFEMPVKVKLSEGLYTFIRPSSEEWRSSPFLLDHPSEFEVNRNFYVDTERVRPQ